MHQDIELIQERIQKQSRFVAQIRAEVGKVIVGQRYMIDRLLIGLLADGHVLLEGVPGLAKTLTVRTPVVCDSCPFSAYPVHPGSSACGPHRYLNF